MYLHKIVLHKRRHIPNEMPAMHSADDLMSLITMQISFQRLVQTDSVILNRGVYVS